MPESRLPQHHRQECIRFFNDPPFTTAFLTKPIGAAHYAVDPIFGRGERDDVCSWISVSGSIDCEYVSQQLLVCTALHDNLARPASGAFPGCRHSLRPQNHEEEVLRRLRRTETDQETSSKYQVHTSNLLTLSNSRAEQAQGRSTGHDFRSSVPAHHSRQ